MSWTPVLTSFTGTSPDAVLQWSLYEPSQEYIYYFGTNSSGVAASCRFVDVSTQQPVTCPIQGQKYFMEVYNPPGRGMNEYLTILYSDISPPGPSFGTTKNKVVSSDATYFIATGPVINGFIDFKIYRADKPTIVTNIKLYLTGYTFNCETCGCLDEYICNDNVCVDINGPPPIVIPDEPDEPIDCDGKPCGGKCYGICPDNILCRLNEDTLEYECYNPSSKPIWTEWWFWMVIIFSIIILIVIGVVLSKVLKPKTKPIIPKIPVVI